MKIKAHKKELENALKKVSPATETKATLPVLQGIYFYNDMMLATNLDTGIKTKYDCEILEKGRAVLPGRKMLNIVKSMPNEQVTITVDNLNAEIECGNTEFQVSGFDPEEFPELPEVGKNSTLEVDSKALAETLDKTIFALSNNDSQPALKAVCLEDGYATATNTYRLSNTETDLSFSERLLLPGEAAKEVKKMCGAVDNVKVEYNESFIRFTFGDTVLITRLIAAEFPNWQDVLPDDCEYDTLVTVDKGQLINALKRANIVAQEEGGEVLFSISDNMKITAESDESKVNEEIEVNTNGGEVKIKVDASYMIDGLKKIKDDTVRIELQDKLNPLVIREHGWIYVVMPIRQD